MTEEIELPRAGPASPEPDRSRPARRLFWRVLRTAAVAYAAVLILAYLFQRRLQYFPDASAVPLPRGDEFRGLEELEATASDGVKVRGWHWPGSRPVTLLIFHGNAGHRGHRLEWVQDLHSLGLGVCILDYRGYGGSDGSPTEEGLYRDAERVLGWLEARSPGRVVYLGESLGSAVAVDLALRHEPAAMILQSSFPSAAAVARRAYPFLPVGFLMKDRYESAGKIARIACPILVIHGDGDSIVPAALGRALFEAAHEPKEWYSVPGADHNDLPWAGGKDYLARIDAFLRRHVSGGE